MVKRKAKVINQTKKDKKKINRRYKNKYYDKKKWKKVND